MTRFRNRLNGRLAGAALALAALGSLVPAVRGLAAAPEVAIVIEKFAYGPREITVKPGTAITWTNRDGTPHTVTAADKSFASKGLDTEDKFQHVFSTEGDFNYICTLHPYMTGVVHVRK